LPARRITCTLSLIVRNVAFSPYIGIYLLFKKKVRSHRHFFLCSAIVLPFFLSYSVWYIHMPNYHNPYT
jgi:hypothetical protein